MSENLAIDLDRLSEIDPLSKTFPDHLTAAVTYR